jgi:hypothetical protein
MMNRTAATVVTAAIVVAFVTVVVIILIFMNKHSDIDGFWIAPNDFCEDAGLSTFLMCIRKNACYMVVANQEGILINDDFMLKKSHKTSPGGSFSISLERNDTDAESTSWPYSEIIPDTFNVKIVKRHNKMILFNNDKIYAVVYKDLELSDTLCAARHAAKKDVV